MLWKSNPNFVRVCGFAPKREKDEYCGEHVPSLRKKASVLGFPCQGVSLDDGVPVCWNGHEMEYKGMRYEQEKFIYHRVWQQDS